MKTLLTAGSLVFSAGMALAAYVIDVEGGDRVTVESYWEEGERIHITRGGVSLSIRKEKIRSIQKLPDLPPPAPSPEAGVSRPAPAPDAEPLSRAELEKRESAIARHLLRVQREKFEAEARGEPPSKLFRLAKELKRTQQRRLEVLRELDRLEPAE